MNYRKVTGLQPGPRTEACPNDIQLGRSEPEFPEVILILNEYFLLLVFRIIYNKKKITL